MDKKYSFVLVVSWKDEPDYREIPCSSKLGLWQLIDILSCDVNSRIIDIKVVEDA